MGTPLDVIDRLAAQIVLTDALQLALQNALFDCLQKPRSASQLAETIGWHAAPTSHLLALLWSAELLTRYHSGVGYLYQTAEDAQPYLCTKGGRYVGNAWQYRLMSLRQFGQQLDSIVRQPLPDNDNQQTYDHKWAEAASVQIAEEQRALTADTACEIAATLPHFHRRARLLDIGGGPGLISVALAECYPQLHGVILELPLTAAIAQQHLTAAGINNRFSALAELNEGDRFDVIWCSSFLHFVADPASTLADLHRRLNPGGVLISAHARLGDDPQQVSRVMPYFLPLLMRGKHVFHNDQLSKLLITAGFRVKDRKEMRFPMAPLQVLCAFRDR